MTLALVIKVAFVVGTALGEGSSYHYYGVMMGLVMPLSWHVTVNYRAPKEMWILLEMLCISYRYTEHLI